MTIPVIITICILLLLSYIFDISSSFTKIPSVILLLFLGWLVRQGSTYLSISIPDLTPLLPILGTIGLILIVLEGSLELELNKEKLPFIGKASIIALFPMLLFSMIFAFSFQYFEGSSFYISLANAIPFAIISSAIAIPSVQNLRNKKQKEFVTYESSLSDIFGVIFFNFITLNDNIGHQSIGFFIIELFLILIITFIATIGLAFLLSKSKHNVKFVPIILMVVTIYAVSKIYHLPALIFILLFGIILGNLDELKHFKFVEKLKPDILKHEVHKFKDLTTEIAFLIRALFFLLFGYLIETQELLNTETLAWTVSITSGIFIIRFVFLKLFKFHVRPLLFIAPRGLITILLFLSLPLTLSVPYANKSLIIQVIILTAFIMMIGLMTNNKKPNTILKDNEELDQNGQIISKKEKNSPTKIEIMI